MEIHEKWENTVIISYNEIFIFTSVHKTNTCSKWGHLTIELVWQEFSSIVILLLWTGISSLENCWYEIIWNCLVGKSLLKEQNNISLLLFCWYWIGFCPLDSAPKLISMVVCLFIRDKSFSHTFCTLGC